MPRIALSHGATHYELSGPESGAPVVLLHGGTAPMWTWDHIAPPLVRAGFRVLRYDLYGRGGSDVLPRARHDRALFASQLRELLDALGIARPAHLVGFSFGAATAASFALHEAARVDRLALVAPVLHFAASSRAVRWVRLRGLGGLLMRHGVMPRAARQASRLWAAAPERARYDALAAEALARPGVATAWLAFLRSDALDSYAEVYRALGAQDAQDDARDTPGANAHATLLLRGERDREVPLAHFDHLRQAMPRARVHLLRDAGHGAPFQQPELIARRLIEHFS
jgi:pimeloyl-ACP methyl ester carboxylesterase